MKISSTLYLAPLALVVAACGGGSDKDPPVTLIDAPQQQVDAPAVTCTAPAMITALTNPFFQYTPDTDEETTALEESWYVGLDLNADPLVDWLDISLYEGAPPTYTTPNFPATPFTIQLTGAETQYATCSTCLVLLTDVDLENSTPMGLAYADDYMATGGSITVTTLTATQIAGTLNNVTFAQMDFAQDGTQTPSASNCTSASEASVAFTGMMMPEARDGRRARIAAPRFAKRR
jgi:hypothetical protein